MKDRPTLRRVLCGTSILGLWVSAFFATKFALYVEYSELLGWIPLCVVFAGVNVAAVWAAMGPGSWMRRQASMTLVAVLAAGGVVVGEAVVGSGDMGILFLGCTLLGCFVTAQIPGWVLRYRFGLRLEADENASQWSAPASGVLDTLVILLMGIVTVASVGWGLRLARHFPVMTDFVACGAVMSCNAVLAGFSAPRSAFYSSASGVVLSAIRTLLATVTLVAALDVVAATRVGVNAATYEEMLFFCLVVGMIFACIMGFFVLLRITGVRMTRRMSSAAGETAESEFLERAATAECVPHTGTASAVSQDDSTTPTPEVTAGRHWYQFRIWHVCLLMFVVAVWGWIHRTMAYTETREEFFIAIHQNDVELVRELLQRHPSLAEEYSAYYLLDGFTVVHWGESPLTVSVMQESKDVFKYLLTQGPDLDDSGLSHSPPIIAAVCVDDLFYLSTLLAHGASPTTRDENGRTAADVAQELGRTEHLKLLKQYQ